MTDEGRAYRFDYDFETLLQEYTWESMDTFQSLTVMPCASYAAKTERGWNPFFLSVSEPGSAPAGITMELADQTQEQVTVRFTNQSGEDWGYGYAYRLDVQLSGVWYQVPAEQEMAFIEILCMLPDGGSVEEPCALTPYGELPAGTYRVVMENLTAEFEIAE